METIKKIIFSIGIFIIIILTFSQCKNSKDDTSNLTEIGQVLKTENFDITVNKTDIKDKVSAGAKYYDINTGDEIYALKTENGSKYLVINITVKNTGLESNTLPDGSVWINYNGNDYEYNDTEFVVDENYGLKEMNPLVSRTTNLVFKIPTEIKGKAYYQPYSSQNDKKISLGTL